MAKKELTHINRIRGNTQTCDNYTGVDGEFIINRDTQSIRIHDNKKKGGYGTIDAMHYPDALPEQVPTDLRTGAHVTVGNGRLDGGQNTTATSLAGAGLKAEGGKLVVNAPAINGVVHTTGVETIAGNKSFTNPIALKRQDSGPAVFVDNIQNDQYRDIMASKDGGGRISFIRFLKTSSGNSVAMYSCKEDASLGGAIVVTTDANDVTTTSAPTPPLTDNSTQIATTEWVKRVLPSANGFKVNPDGTVSVDFSAMDTATINAIRKEMGVKVPLTASKDFYVNVATGSDTLDEGRGESADKPFKTIQACINYIVSVYDLGMFVVTVNVAEGTYNEAITLPNYVSSTGYIRLFGAGEATTKIKSKNTDQITVNVRGGVYYLQSMTIENSCVLTTVRRRPRVLVADNYSTLNITNIRAGFADITTGTSNAVSTYWLNAVNNSTLIINGNIELYDDGAVLFANSGSASIFCATQQGLIRCSGSTTQLLITLDITSNFRNFRTATASDATLSFAPASGYQRATFVGSVAATRYSVDSGGKIMTGNAGEDYFPGTVAGTVEAETFSWYK